MNAYLVIFGNASSDKANAFTARIQELVENWWHWMDDVWIILDPSPSRPSQRIEFWRDKAFEVLGGPGTAVLVFHLQAGTPVGGILTKGAVDWLTQHWDPQLESKRITR